MNAIDRMAFTLDSLVAGGASALTLNEQDHRITRALRERHDKGEMKGQLVHPDPDWSSFPRARAWFVQGLRG